MGIFCRFLVSQGLLKSDLSKELTIVRPPERLAEKLITEEDLRRICEEARALNLNYIADVAIVTFDLALRLSEVCNLKRSWIDFDNARLTVCQDDHFVTKSGRELVKPIRDRSIAILEAACLGLAHDDHLFRNTLGNPLTPKRTSKTFKRVVRKAHLPETVSFHGLRHGGLTRLIENGASLEVVQRFAGHATLDMTLRYCHLSVATYERLILERMT